MPSVSTPARGGGAGDARTPVDGGAQCISPEVVTPSGGMEGDGWRSWTLQENDVVDIMTSPAARLVDQERTEREERNRVPPAVVVFLRDTNWYQINAFARRALCSIITLLLDTPDGMLPLLTVKLVLKWKTVWWRDLGCLYSFIKRVGREVLTYRNGDISSTHPLAAGDVAYLQRNGCVPHAAPQHRSPLVGQRATGEYTPKCVVTPVTSPDVLHRGGGADERTGSTGEAH